MQVRASKFLFTGSSTRGCVSHRRSKQSGATRGGVSAKCMGSPHRLGPAEVVGGTVQSAQRRRGDAERCSRHRTDTGLARWLEG